LYLPSINAGVRSELYRNRQTLHLNGRRGQGPTQAKP